MSRLLVQSGIRSSVWTLLLPLILVSRPVIAQDAPKPEKTFVSINADETTDAKTHSGANSSTKKSERRKRASAAFAALGAISIIGLCVIAWIMVWGQRLRRLIRGEAPVQRTLGDDFWFLKPPKPTASESEFFSARQSQFPPASGSRE
jgi:hypothetical protein